MALSPLTALSPLDGRYSSKVEPLRQYFSELALIRYRILIEIEWLQALAAEPAIAEVPELSATTVKELCIHYLNDLKAGLILGKGGRPKKPSTIVTDTGPSSHAGCVTHPVRSCHTCVTPSALSCQQRKQPGMTTGGGDDRAFHE